MAWNRESHGEARRKTSTKKEKRRGNAQTVMDSRNGRHDGVEDEEGYLLVVAVVVGNGRDGRKSSPEVRRKPSFSKLRR